MEVIVEQEQEQIKGRNIVSDEKTKIYYFLFWSCKSSTYDCNNPPARKFAATGNSQDLHMTEAQEFRVEP